MTDYLGKKVKVVVDRPLGSIHPEHHNIYYMVNYGYIPDTVSGDGKEIDAYIIGEFIMRISWWFQLILKSTVKSKLKPL